MQQNSYRSVTAASIRACPPQQVDQPVSSPVVLHALRCICSVPDIMVLIARDLPERARQLQSLASFPLCCWPDVPMALQIPSPMLQALPEMQRTRNPRDLGSARRIQVHSESTASRKCSNIANPIAQAIKQV